MLRIKDPFWFDENVIYNLDSTVGLPSDGVDKLNLVIIGTLFRIRMKSAWKVN